MTQYSYQITTQYNPTTLYIQPNNSILGNDCCSTAAAQLQLNCCCSTAAAQRSGELTFEKDSATQRNTPLSAGRDQTRKGQIDSYWGLLSVLSLTQIDR